MSTIQFKETNCKNCYKCIRSCPVKAISFKNDQAQIIEDSCILCGNCLKVCPQNAKSVKSDVEKVKSLIDRKFKVYASVAPSFSAAFNIEDVRQLNAVFSKLGFTFAQETAVGASMVTNEYQNLMGKKEMKNIITTACPTIVSLVEMYYPEIIPQLAPVVSPMIAHAKKLKEMYGPRIKIVFVGPCLAKKDEYKDSSNDDLIDAVITFEELEEWIKEKNISLKFDVDTEKKEFFNISSRFYPIPGGIIKSLDKNRKLNYKLLKVDGIERCIEILEDIKSNSIKDYFIEMNSCFGGCLGGACMNSDCKSQVVMREKLISYVNKSAVYSTDNTKDITRVNLLKTFKDKSKKYVLPDKKEIDDILHKTNKYTKEQELNCGACGYPTCRDKAVAVFYNKADINMCLPYMRERAESISNLIINSSPNAIFALNEDLFIQEINLTARKMFKLEYEEVINKNIYEILDCPDICIVGETKNDIYNQKVCYKSYNLVVEQSIQYIKENHSIIIIMKNITKDEKVQEQLYKMKSETVDIAQKVIEKQMRVAQEIASLLGETTAETKVALTKLKKIIQSEIGED
ncbi:MAG: [Fe-Fe] hydrogenase large subunit C-terminal domain-containing protein [Bacillota bacterium]|nr:[Fe-Fe] hydrogenase large subunit C-terminal domain-containing protein [Bacillota bacterium]